MTVNGEAIYRTRVLPPYKTGRVCLTQKRDDGVVYAVYLAGEGEEAPPKRIDIEGVVPGDGARVTMLRVEGELEWRKEGAGISAGVPVRFREDPPCGEALVVRVEGE